MKKLILICLLAVMALPAALAAQTPEQATEQTTEQAAKDAAAQADEATPAVPCGSGPMLVVEKPAQCPCCGSDLIADAVISKEDRAVIQGVEIFGVQVPEQDIPRWVCQVCNAAFHLAEQPDGGKPGN